jgi:GDPmannose 4,6-dehydratase
MYIKSKKAIITGIAGQDGSYLAEFLIKKNYQIFGVVKPEQILNQDKLWRIKNIKNDIEILSFDLNDKNQLVEQFCKIRPDEIYHLASNVNTNTVFEDEINIINSNLWGSISLLRVIKEYKKDCRFYCAGSSLMFGEVTETPQNEQTRFNPTTPYGIAKVATYHYLKMYREVYEIFACMGILFNHESPRRDINFLPKKIVKAVAEIKFGSNQKLALGDIEIKRDWSFAGDVVESMWLMLQRDKPSDYVIGSGELHSIREILEIAFGYVNLDWKKYVVKDEKYIRKVEYLNLCADSKKALTELGWQSKIIFKNLIIELLNFEIDIIGKKND